MLSAVPARDSADSFDPMFPALKRWAIINKAVDLRPKPERRMRPCGFPFVIHHSDFLRHSSFVISAW
jgi:hypothetical protein